MEDEKQMFYLIFKALVISLIVLMITVIFYYFLRQLVGLHTDLNIVSSWRENYDHTADRPRLPPIPFNGTMIFYFPGVLGFKKREKGRKNFM